ncbi:MAG: hypothetical protein NC401_17475, partial [Ruminococcus sp.]|nr:hypothetical protein [Ruminococcus sp.]
YTSSFQDDPTKHDFKLKLDMLYQYVNQRTGDEDEYRAETPITSGGGLGRQLTAPTDCTILMADAHHYFWVDGVSDQYYSYAVR